ncbi:helix-turn-helix domain-containing protein [Roseibium sp. MMSF_3544]|uniref:helix-turn-helix domain-containing protein n=1 Tax=unclassified Roseibium TaxID=2629323 RepID=UPI00273D33C1|nr:helix-turn-helix transcriptional regulator [Roseibium sp. MMSF_3544]
MPKTESNEIDRLIGIRLKERRIELGMTHKQLGAALGMSFQQVQKYEAGKNSIAVATLLEACTVLDVPVTYFLSDNPIPPAPCVTTFPFAYKSAGGFHFTTANFPGADRSVPTLVLFQWRGLVYQSQFWFTGKTRFVLKRARCSLVNQRPCRTRQQRRR